MSWLKSEKMKSFLSTLLHRFTSLRLQLKTAGAWKRICLKFLSLSCFSVFWVSDRPVCLLMTRSPSSPESSASLISYLMELSPERKLFP